MKNFESLLAAYAAFWAIMFIFDITVSRRLTHAEQDLEKLKQQALR
jgi:hypothetical protein